MEKILGIRIHTISQSDVLAQTKTWLAGNTPHSMFTPNPEMLVLAHKNAVFHDILNRSDLNVCDGFGISLFSKKKMERIPGVDLMESLIQQAADEQKKVYLLGGNPGVALKAATALKLIYPTLSISGYTKDADMQVKAYGDLWKINEEGNTRILEHIKKEAPDMLFVAFGHGKQEWWIDTFQDQLPSLRISMGVGGSFDFFAGSIKRAPKLFRRIGLEWLWRLILEPRRWKRIYTAVITFPYLVLSQRFTQEKS